MRMVCSVILLGASLGAQSLVEYSGAAAGGAVGGVAGKKVSDGMTSIFNKIDKATAKAAGTDKDAAGKNTARDTNAPLFDVGPGVPHSRAAAPAGAPPAPASRSRHASSMRAEAESVPPPPPVHRSSPRRAATPLPEPIAMPALIALPPPPPPPAATAADLKRIAVGANRADVLKLGVPAARIIMYEDGHLVEIFRYQAHDTKIGMVRLSDGTVSNVQVN